MLDDDQSQVWLRRFTQEDMLASGIRVALAAVGPFGAVLSEFATQFVPRQRLDRLQDFAEQLQDRIAGLEITLRERIDSSAPFAALTEEATLAAVRTPSDERRRDLASVIQNGLTHADAELYEDLALLRLLEALNEPQLLILMSYGNYRRTLGDTALQDFHRQHPGVFDVRPPSRESGADELRRWAMRSHYVNELVTRGLLEDSEAVAKSGSARHVKITQLGRLLLRLVNRSTEPE